MSDMSQHANHDLCSQGTTSNIGQRFEIDFFEPDGNTPWTFSISMDSGFGYEVYFDNTKNGGMYQDVWSGSTNPKSYTSGNLAIGLHTFIVYGAEGCCDGEAGAWQFQRGSGATLALTKVNLCATAKEIGIHYFSMRLPSQGSPSTTSVLANVVTIDNAYNVAPASGYCSKYLSTMSQHANHDLCSSGSSSNIGQRFDIVFFEPVGGVSWSFTINMDSGYGYVVHLDGTQVGIMAQDVWDGGSNPKTYPSTSVTLSAGMHTFSVRGGEGCCDGEAGAWMFQRAGGASKYLTFDNLAAVGNGNF